MKRSNKPLTIQLKKTLGCISLLCGSLLSGVANSDEAANLEITPSELNTAIKQISRNIRDIYVIEDDGKKMADYIVERHAAGTYQGLDARAFADKLTADMVDISNDLHMYMRYDPESASSPAPQRRMNEEDMNEAEREEMRQFQSMMRQRALDKNYGAMNFQWLPNNVAVIHISQWFELALLKSNLDSMMTLAEDADAIIFDTRSNPGGSPDGIRYLQGHFLDKEIEMMEFRNRVDNQVMNSPSMMDIDGEKRVGVPMYILVDSNCASACEDFAMTTKDNGFGTVVGEQTAGAGFMNRYVPIIDTFNLSISFAGAFSIASGNNWQGVGVTPDVNVIAPDALDTAYKLILQDKLKNATEDRERQGLQKRINWLEEKLAAKPVISLENYAGTYRGTSDDDRTVSVEGRYLKLTGGRRPVYFKPVAAGIFEQTPHANMRVSFDLKGDNIASLKLHRAQGEALSFPRI